MRRLSVAVITAISTIALTQIASAADLPIKAPALAPAPPPPVYNWTGCYIGINGGWARKDTEFDIGHNNNAFFGPAFSAGSTVSHYDFDGDGGVVGGTVGCNYQWTPNILVGVEADWDWADINASQDVTTSVPLFVNGFGHASEKINSIGTLRGRLGVTFGAMNEWLLYATGGLAWADVDYDYSWAYPGTNELYVGSESSTRTGWTVGGGVEWAFMVPTPVTLKLEGLYYELDGIDFAAPGQTNVGPAGVAHLVNVGNNTGWMLRAGLNWKFWP